MRIHKKQATILFFIFCASGQALGGQAVHDAVTWEDEGTLTFKPLYGAAVDGDRLIVAGAEGVILRSPLSLPSEPVEVLQFSRALDASQQRWDHLYLIGGLPDQQFTLNRRTNVASGAWVTGPELEITDGAGTLLYWESVAVSNAAPNEYYGTTLVP